MKMEPGSDTVVQVDDNNVVQETVALTHETEHDKDVTAASEPENRNIDSVEEAKEIQNDISITLQCSRILPCYR